MTKPIPTAPETIHALINHQREVLANGGTESDCQRFIDEANKVDYMQGEADSWTIHEYTRTDLVAAQIAEAVQKERERYQDFVDCFEDFMANSQAQGSGTNLEKEWPHGLKLIRRS